MWSLGISSPTHVTLSCFSFTWYSYSQILLVYSMNYSIVYRVFLKGLPWCHTSVSSTWNENLTCCDLSIVLRRLGHAGCWTLGVSYVVTARSIKFILMTRLVRYLFGWWWYLWLELDIYETDTRAKARADLTVGFGSIVCTYYSQ